MERKKFIFSIAMIALAPSLLFTSCKDRNKSAAAGALKYTCPMHPQILKDKPGNCPICGMELVPVTSAGGKNELTLSESQIQLANIRTIEIAAGGFNTSKTLNGRLVTNTKLTDVISSRYAGRIEKLYVKETGVPVTKGQVLFQIYSEEMQTLQQDYLLQQKQVSAFPGEKIYATLRDAARNKLRLYGYSDAQIAALSKSGTHPPLVSVRAPSSGIVNEISVSEGQYISEGSPVLTLENFSQLWVEADVYPEEAGEVKAGQSVKVRINGFPEEQTVRLDFISPQLDPSGQILKVRAPITNNGSYQAGMQATVLLSSAKIKSGIALPLDAVIRDGKGAQVWVKTGKNTFASRMVTTGAEDDSKIMISSGLEGVREVVVSGGYLLSSEYILKKGSDPMAGHNH